MGLRDWRSVLNTCNVEGDPKEKDPVTKLLLSTRACVLPATWTSAFIGIFLALIYDGAINWLHAIILFIGLTLAHMTNNLFNDYFDWRSGIDTPEYPRTQYSPHPILAGIYTPRKVLSIALLFTSIDFFIMVYFYLLRGWPIIFFAVLGFLISFNYAGPPLRLKTIGLGEISNFLVWGPLMTVGSFYALTGKITLQVVLLSIPYGLLMLYSLAGKHIDKIEIDKKIGIRTIPVILGEENTRKFIKGTVIFTYIYTLALPILGLAPIWVLLVIFALPKGLTVIKILSQPKPIRRPLVKTRSGRLESTIGGPSILDSIDFNPEGEGNWPLWPLWFVTWTFWQSKSFGYMFVLGLLISVFLPIHFNFVAFLLNFL